MTRHYRSLTDEQREYSKGKKTEQRVEGVSTKVRICYSAMVGGSQAVEVPDDCDDPIGQGGNIVEKSTRFRDRKSKIVAVDVIWESEEVR